MDTRSRGGTSRNEEIHRNTANAHGTSTRRDSNNISHSLDKEHKCRFVPKKERRAGSYLLHKQSFTGAELNYSRMEKLILEFVHAARKLRRGDETPKYFLIEVPLEDNKKETKEKAYTKPTKTSCEWKLFTDGVVSSDGFSAGLMLIDPEGKEYTYTLRFGFETTNNEAEYEALSDRLRISQEMEITSLAIFVE
ncbi:reverse transcriptase domain-containing protein [Tanacetum coccineum]